jgi:hypothetical protein
MSNSFSNKVLGHSTAESFFGHLTVRDFLQKHVYYKNYRRTLTASSSSCRQSQAENAAVTLQLKDIIRQFAMIVFVHHFPKTTILPCNTKYAYACLLKTRFTCGRYTVSLVSLQPRTDYAMTA